MNDIIKETSQRGTIEATIIRANGKKEYIGVVVGGNFFQKVGSYFLIKLSNLKHT